MGYLWFVKKLKNCCFDSEHIKKRFVICGPESLNSIPDCSDKGLHPKVVLLYFLKNFSFPFFMDRAHLPQIFRSLQRYS